MSPLLEVTDLKTRFHTPEGTVYAVNGISFHIDEGETLAVVGESGCGKSVSMLSILQLIPTPPGEIASGSAVYCGSDLLRKTEEEMISIRGKEIAMIFQDPMTSLNPVLTIRRQITESLRVQVRQPLLLTETADKFDILASVAGGGVAGQAGAIRLGIARALIEYNGELRARLKKEGLLTRDARAKERKKYGMAGARKRFQFSKR